MKRHFLLILLLYPSISIGIHSPSTPLFAPGTLSDDTPKPPSAKKKNNFLPESPTQQEMEKDYDTEEQKTSKTTAACILCCCVTCLWCLHCCKRKDAEYDAPSL